MTSRAPARISARTREVYMTGQCAALAVVLAERTGWPIVAFAALDQFASERSGKPDPRTGIRPGVRALDLADSFVHACVLRPDGLAVDAGGVRPLREVLAEVSEGPPGPCPPAVDDVGRTCGPDCVCTEWCFPDEPVVAVFVPAGVLLDAARAGAWPAPRLGAARCVADVLLASSPARVTAPRTRARGHSGGPSPR